MICPFLKNERCSIYYYRPSCCRNFPQTKSGLFCTDRIKCTYDKEGNIDCFNCVNKCCHNVQMPEGTGKLEIIKKLNGTCEECEDHYKHRSTFKGKPVYYINVADSRREQN